MDEIILALVIGFIADLIIGDPHGMWHPICFVGNMIAVFEKGLRRIFPKTEKGEFGPESVWSSWFWCVPQLFLWES
ncbi:MAG: hypothetical protein V8R80_03595 [Eubacterium sp.]